MASPKKTVWDCGDLIFHGRYEVLRVLHGSMGIIYVVKDLEYSEELARVGRPQILAAKTLLPDLADLPALRRRFIEEAKIWIKMRPQQHIVRAYFSDTFLGVPYVFADYVASGLFPNSLAEWVRRRITPFPVALYFTMEILDGLWFAYEDGVAFHGDLKPANILINKNCLVKITDWGLSRLTIENVAAAKVLSSQPNPDLDLEDSLRYRGTPGYTAPELARGAGATRAVDIFSLGVILGEMLTGRLLPAGVSIGDLEMTLAHTYPWRDDEASSVAGVLADFLSPDPEDRMVRYRAGVDRLTDLFTSVTDLRLLPPYLLVTKIDPQWVGQTAFSLINLGEKAEGYERFRRLEQIAGTIDQEGAKHMIVFNLDHGDFVLPQELLEDLEAKVSSGSDDLDRFVSLIGMHALAGNHDRGRALYESWKERGRLDEAAIRKLIDLPEGVLGKGERLRLARQLTDLTPDSVASWMKYAETCSGQGVQEEALRACAQAEKAGTLSADHWVLYGHILSLLGKTKKALSTFDRALHLDEGNGVAWYNRGVALRTLGRRAESQESFRKAVERDGPKGLAHNHLGSLLLEERRLAEAAHEFQEASRYSPDNPKVWFNLGQTVRALGNLQDALRYYDIALSLNPNYELARQARAEVLAAL